MHVEGILPSFWEGSPRTLTPNYYAQDADLYGSSYVFAYIQGSPPEMTLRFARDLEVVCSHPKLLHAK